MVPFPASAVSTNIPFGILPAPFTVFFKSYSNGLQLIRHLQLNNLISHEYESRERQVLSLLICYKINFTSFFYESCRTRNTLSLLVS
jgi:hypothetical protein